MSENLNDCLASSNEDDLAYMNPSTLHGQTGHAVEHESGELITNQNQSFIEPMTELKIDQGQQDQKKVNVVKKERDSDTDNEEMEDDLFRKAKRKEMKLSELEAR